MPLLVILSVCENVLYSCEHVTLINRIKTRENTYVQISFTFSTTNEKKLHVFFRNK